LIPKRAQLGKERFTRLPVEQRNALRSRLMTTEATRRPFSRGVVAGLRPARRQNGERNEGSPIGSLHRSCGVGCHACACRIPARRRRAARITHEPQGADGVDRVALARHRPDAALACARGIRRLAARASRLACASFALRLAVQRASRRIDAHAVAAVARRDDQGGRAVPRRSMRRSRDPPAVRARAQSAGTNTAFEAFGARIAAESARWKSVVVAARIPLQQ